jgi:hypothetical protein
MAKTSEDDARQTREDERMASTPATYVDGYTVSWWSRGVRISFAEYMNDERYYRLAVMMELDDAEQLGQTLLKCVAEAKAEPRSRNAE